MSIKDQLIYIFYLKLNDCKIINNIVRLVYVWILIPILELVLKIFFPQIVRLEYRHSILDKVAFRAFISDIDTTLIIKDNFDPTGLIKFFLSMKTFFIMLDFPEVYTETEYKDLNSMKMHPDWHFVETIWNIRKINWNYKVLNNDNSLLTVAKKTRSIRKSMSKIFIKKTYPKLTFTLDDLNSTIAQIFKNSDTKTICYYSPFLEMINKSGMHLELNEQEFYTFNQTMPGEAIDKIKNTISSQRVLNVKMMLTKNEIYLTKSSIRVDKSLKKNTSDKIAWVKKLEDQL